MNNLVWQSVTWRPGNERSFSLEECSSLPGHSGRQTAPSPPVQKLGKSARRSRELPSVGLRPPSVSPRLRSVSSLYGALEVKRSFSQHTPLSFLGSFLLFD